jgi:hypothetical protein
MTYDLSLTCPWCDKRNELVSEVRGNQRSMPTPGSVSICWGCHRPALFTPDAAGDLTLTQPSTDELAELLAQPHIAEAIAALELAAAMIDLGQP